MTNPIAREPDEARHLVRNILYTRFPTEVDADTLRSVADEIIAALARTPTKGRETASPARQGDEPRMLKGDFPPEAVAALAKIMGETASPTPRDTLVIRGRYPNTPAMLLCAKLAESGTLVPIAKMDAAIAALNSTQQPTRETEALLRIASLLEQDRIEADDLAFAIAELKRIGGDEAMSLGNDYDGAKSQERVEAAIADLCEYWRCDDCLDALDEEAIARGEHPPTRPKP